MTSVDSADASSRIRGIAMPFRIEPGTGRVAQSSGRAKLRENLLHLLRTSVGERFLRRDYGAGLRDVLQEPHAEAMQALIERRVVAAVGRFEPRVAIQEILVERRGDTVVAELVYRIGTDAEPDHVAVPLDVADGGGR